MRERRMKFTAIRGVGAMMVVVILDTISTQNFGWKYISSTHCIM
jgi:hypothetical protein